MHLLCIWVKHRYAIADTVRRWSAGAVQCRADRGGPFLWRRLNSSLPAVAGAPLPYLGEARRPQHAGDGKRPAVEPAVGRGLLTRLWTALVPCTRREEGLTYNAS